MWFDAIIASLPILSFILLLTVFKLKGWVAGVLSAVVASIIAWWSYDMLLGEITTTAWGGVKTGLYPVGTIVLAAIFLYKLSVKSGKFDSIKESIISITPDRRIQVLLIAYCFGAFLEGAAGFGVPVAITAIILVGLGFKPVQAAGVCLVANIAGGSYGAMGIPVTTPSALTGVDALDVAMRTSFIVPIISFVLPFLLVFLIDGFKGVKETLPTTALCGGTFALVQFAVLNTVGAQLVDIISASVTIIVLMLFLRGKQNHSLITITYAWLPFIMLTVLVLVVDTSIALILAGVLTIAIYRIHPNIIGTALSESVRELVVPIATICAVLALASVCNVSGMSETLGLTFASTGGLFPLFSPVLGWIGVFLTGSVVNSGSLFAPLQVVTAGQLGIEPSVMVAANVIGGDMAKMISPQSIAVASAAVGLSGKENEIFRFTIKFSLILLAFVGIIHLILY